MYSETLDKFCSLAVKKTDLLRRKPGAFFAGAVAGGAYIGLGIVLILSVGAAVPPDWQKAVMGATFAIALILVVIAGAELYTGHTMYLSLGRLAGRVDGREAMRTMTACWVGNLLGSLLVALLFAAAGGNGLLDDDHSLLLKVFAYKTHGSVTALFAKAVLCNWLVCLALWMSSRVDSDTARCIVIFWCLLAFIASGYEHSVANMTLLSLGVIAQGGETAALLAAGRNLAIVTLGNFVGGAVLVGGLYWVAGRSKLAAASGVAAGDGDGACALLSAESK